VGNEAKEGSLGRTPTEAKRRSWRFIGEKAGEFPEVRRAEVRGKDSQDRGRAQEGMDRGGVFPMSVQEKEGFGFTGAAGFALA